MRTLGFIAFAGLVAQLIDGALGMGFGATSTTLLLSLASLTPATASAVVHVAELGTTFASGASHMSLGNVNWKVALSLGIPGAIGAFAGATVLSHLPLDSAAPLTACILIGIGVSLVWRFSRGRVRRPARDFRPSHLPVLGLFAGFLDASGGGGWGPVTSSTLLAFGQSEPRRVVGTVNTAEFFVTAAASAGFAIGLWHDIVSNVAFSIAMLVGGVVAAPVGAWLTSRLNPAVLGGLVGTTLVVTNVPKTGVAHPALWMLAAAVVGIGFCLLGLQRARRNRAADAEAGHAQRIDVAPKARRSAVSPRA